MRYVSEVIQIEIVYFFMQTCICIWRAIWPAIDLYVVSDIPIVCVTKPESTCLDKPGVWTDIHILQATA